MWTQVRAQVCQQSDVRHLNWKSRGCRSGLRGTGWMGVQDWESRGLGQEQGTKAELGEGSGGGIVVAESQLACSAFSVTKSHEKKKWHYL